MPGKERDAVAQLAGVVQPRGQARNAVAVHAGDDHLVDLRARRAGSQQAAESD
jgi:hypothetical protein